MKKKGEISKGLAKILKDLRKKHGLSKLKMANLLYIDDKTWSRYEEGLSEPTVTEFINIFATLGEDCMKPVLDLLHPDIYKDICPDTTIDGFKEAAVYYINNIASDRFIRQFNYLLYGQHGSSSDSQMQEFTMINHLPLQYKVIIAENIRTMWRLAESRNEILSKNHIMPDLVLFDDALKAGQKAAGLYKQSYNNTMEKD